MIQQNTHPLQEEWIEEKVYKSADREQKMKQALGM